MKYKRSIETNFNYMSNNLVLFMTPNWDGIATIGIGASAGALAGGIGANIYNQNQINSNKTAQEADRLNRYGDKFNQGYEDWQNAKNKGIIADRSTPEGKRFIDTGDKFINEDQKIRDKYSNKALTYASLAGGALLGGSLGLILAKRRGLPNPYGLKDRRVY